MLNSKRSALTPTFSCFSRSGGETGRKISSGQTMDCWLRSWVCGHSVHPLTVSYSCPLCFRLCGGSNKSMSLSARAENSRVSCEIEMVKTASQAFNKGQFIFLRFFFFFFLMWPILKSLLHLLHYCFCCSCSVFWLWGMWSLSS